MGRSIESRFEQYCKQITASLGHSDRHLPAEWYLKGLILPGERKSIEPMAARVCPENVRAAHQSMHHLVAKSEWSDDAVLTNVTDQVLPMLHKGDTEAWWILDDTGHAKKGRHSVGVTRQYCGRLGKTDNCQVAVSLSFANCHGSLPLAYQLYLPKEWAEDTDRSRKAGVPEDIVFRTKGEIARAQIQAALSKGVPQGIVLADAAYGDEAALRDWLTEQQLTYAVNVRAQTTVWWGEYQPAETPLTGRGRPRTRVQRDADHQPIDVLSLAHQLPKRAWKTVTWREGTNASLRSRFARVRVRAAQGNRARGEEWLLIEWPESEEKPVHYWLSTMNARISFESLVSNAKARWMIERDYQELKSELGLSHYEGRNWRGFHHHATLCIAAYGFLVLERLRGKKNSAARLQAPPVPESYQPRGGSGSNATSCSMVDRKLTL
jgi:SRSO17 transposase